MSVRPTDDLYVRYMKAYSASAEHTSSCPACQADQPCAEGAQLHGRFARLQDTYRARQQQRR